MKVKTAETIINSKIQESILENWKTNQKIFVQDDVLDDLTSVKYPNLKVTLRIPFRLRGTTNHILVKSDIEFTKERDKIVLSINCFIVEPIIMSGFFGFLTSFIFLSPFYLFPKVNLIIPVIFGIVISGIYFGLFYSRLKSRSKQFILELKRKYLYK